MIKTDIISLGDMGSGLAKNLIKYHHIVKIYLKKTKHKKKLLEHSHSNFYKHSSLLVVR